MSKLREHLQNQHNLILLESEVQDILSLAREEVELPDDEEIKDFENGLNIEPESQWSDAFLPVLRAGAEIGIKWALSKVRNPYPKSIRF
jgi:hypothetical protein